jgi:2-amino-4-hydroxy-6-hydroxymethyldihydropteridine diphosphokinase
VSPREGVPVLIALGANLGDRRATLDAAVAALGASAGVTVTAVSPWIETLPVGGPPGQPRFLNGALAATSMLSAHALLARLQELERAFGRDRDTEERNGPRALDLDLLFYGDDEIRSGDLIVPHPRLEERIFVLEPLAALAPEKRLPRSGATVSERLRELRAEAAG